MKKRIFIVFGVLTMCSGIVFICTHIGFNTSPSVGFVIYWHRPVDSIITGKYYLIRYDGSEYSGLITKQAACLPGDILARNAQTFYCNGKEIARIHITHDIEGRPYPQYHAPETGEILGGIFALGDSINSYDSRYIGPFDINDFEREVTPIW